MCLSAWPGVVAVGGEDAKSGLAAWQDAWPVKAPLDIEWLGETEHDGVKVRALRYTGSIAGGEPQRIYALYALPPSSGPGQKVPAIVQIHGGGQTCETGNVAWFARRGYACLAFDWGGPRDGRSPKKTTVWGSAVSRDYIDRPAGGVSDVFLLHAVLARPALRTGRRMSHIFRFDVPMYPKPLMVTDAALNIRPTLTEKLDIIHNAIDLAHILGIPNPKVAILSAVETVNPDLPSTIDAAALCKMADRGQLKGGIVDGPLAFDNAISAHAAQIKGIVSPVAGDADILMVPDLESGNMLAKQLEYLAGATGSGLVLGARIPIALTSRADGPTTRVASALLGLLAPLQGGTNQLPEGRDMGLQATPFDALRRRAARVGNGVRQAGKADDAAP
jgi:hypothetical protein